MYCVKCKKTETNNITRVQTKNKRHMLKGVCSICGVNKSTFISREVSQSSTGKGFNLNDMINNSPIELHMYADKGEDIPNGSFNGLQKYSYCGPGTRYEQRTKEGYKGINELDNMCKLHDQFYNEYTDTKTRNIIDIALAHGAEKIARNQNYDNPQRKDANFISGIMRNKARFGMGLHRAKYAKDFIAKNSKN